jgi:hypothetical protein
MRKILTIAIVTLNILLHAASAASIRLVRTPHFQFAPGYAVLQPRVEPDARNRQYCVFYEGGASGSRCRDLAGASSPATQEELTLKDIPAGHYVAVVKVGRNDGTVIDSGTVAWDVLEPGQDVPENP